MTQNTVVRLVKRPSGMVTPDCFSIAQEAVAAPAEGEVTIKVAFVSLDPAMRGWMVDRESYVPPIGIGEIMRAGVVGEVTASNSPQYAVGDTVTGWGGVAQYLTGPSLLFNRVDPGLASDDRHGIRSHIPDDGPAKKWRNRRCRHPDRSRNRCRTHRA